MKRTISLGAMSASMLIAACASTGEPPINQRNAAILEGLETTGETVGCLQVRSVDSIKPVTDGKFLLEVGSRYYLSKTNGRCTGASQTTSRLEYNLPTGQLCSGEIISVVDNQSGILRGNCALGQFEELRPKG
ncbi:MAG: hypothetical protein AAFR21_05845 [Pseudomonadota bacterium]